MADDSAFRDLSDSIKATLYERLTNPFSQTLMVVVPVLYWKVILAALFAKDRYRATLDAIDEAKLGWPEVLHLAIGVISVGIVLPWLGVAMAWAQKHASAKLRAIKHDKLLTSEESEKILKESAGLREQNRQLLSLLSEAESQGYHPREEPTTVESASKPEPVVDEAQYRRAVERYENLRVALTAALLGVYQQKSKDGEVTLGAGIEGDSMEKLTGRIHSLKANINEASVATLGIPSPPGSTAPQHTWADWFAKLKAAEQACPGIVRALESKAKQLKMESEKLRVEAAAKLRNRR